jgi:hypothetical protein
MSILDRGTDLTELLDFRKSLQLVSGCLEFSSFPSLNLMAFLYILSQHSLRSHYPSLNIILYL